MRILFFQLFQVILFCSFANAQWVPVSSSTASNLNDIQFINDQVGFIGGDGGILLKTNDYGDHWNLIGNGAFGNARRILFMSEATGYIISGNELFQSVDSGTSWTSISSFGIETPGDLFFTGADTGFLISSIYGPPGGSFIYKTINSGQNWLKTDSFPTIPTLQDIRFLNRDSGFISGYGGTVIKTVDGGANWTQTQIPSGATLFSIYYTNDTTCYVAGYPDVNGSEVAKTTDAGNTWLQLPSGGSSNVALRDMFFPSPDTGYAVGDLSRIIYTNNAGATWQVSNPGVTENFYGTWFLSDTIGFVVGTNGTILKTTNAAVLGTSLLPQLHRGFKMYPNPFRNSAIIQFPSNVMDAELTILNGHGQEIKRIKNISGQHVTFFRDQLPDGLYFILLTQPDKPVISDKLIISY